jgi:hypothetical protein
MVRCVVPGSELRDFTMKVARRTCRTLGELPGLIYNLNEGEDGPSRRRFHFANGPENQIEGARSAMRRFMKSPEKE